MEAELDKVQENATELFEFAYADIESLEPKITQLSLIDYCSGMVSFTDVRNEVNFE